MPDINGVELFSSLKVNMTRNEFVTKLGSDKTDIFDKIDTSKDKTLQLSEINAFYEQLTKDCEDTKKSQKKLATLSIAAAGVAAVICGASIVAAPAAAVFFGSLALLNASFLPGNRKKYNNADREINDLKNTYDNMLPTPKDTLSKLNDLF